MIEGKKEECHLNLLFETSWEVCNKIGGIYTVLSTKAKTLQKLYKDKVIFVGPDVWSDNNPSPFLSKINRYSSPGGNRHNSHII